MEPQPLHPCLCPKKAVTQQNQEGWRTYNDKREPRFSLALTNELLDGRQAQAVPRWFIAARPAGTWAECEQLQSRLRAGKRTTHETQLQDGNRGRRPRTGRRFRDP